MSDEQESPSGEVELPSEDVPPLDFTTFVLSLSTSALANLGEVHHPEGGQRVELPMARQTIELLGLLEDKTRGNLSGEEERLLSQVIVDLKLRYIAKYNG